MTFAPFICLSFTCGALLLGAWAVVEEIRYRRLDKQMREGFKAARKEGWL